ncbi:MAG: SDR family oxidoreductase [Sphingomonadales bacterium]|nr:SDR family oxidoreductase [Sphingomonadales bacterium]
MRFKGKKVLVTGAASGIGRATAIRLASEGATLTIGDINEAGLRETATMLDGSPRIQPFNAADMQSCRTLVEAAASDGLDVVCNISGLLKWGPSEEFSVEDFEHLMTVNATSVFAICQAALPYLVKSKGCIVNTASTAALQELPIQLPIRHRSTLLRQSPKAWRLNLPQRVRSNAICPGHVNTPMGNSPPPPGDVDWSLVMRNAPKLADGSCDPKDVAAMFAYLASDEARKVTGSLFTIDGGQLAG